MSEEIVKGLSDLAVFLDQLPVKLQKNVIRGALRQGANEIKSAAVANCPIGPPSAQDAEKYHLYAGALRDSIRVGTRSKGLVVTATVTAGGKRKGVDVWYARLIEFTGAVAHLIFPLNRKAISIGGGPPRAMVRHPGFQPKPFMRPALDTKANPATVAVGEYMKERLAEKHGLDTSGVLIEGDS